MLDHPVEGGLTSGEGGEGVSWVEEETLEILLSALGVEEAVVDLQDR